MQLYGFFFLWMALLTMQCISISNEVDGSVLTINGDTFDIESPPDAQEFDISIPGQNQKHDTSINSPNSDKFVDLILVGARELIKDQGLDPAELPDAIAKFSKTILGIKIWGSAKVWKGSFSGLSTITRTGPTSLEPKDDKLHLTANIGIKNAKSGYSASAEFMSIGVKAKASVDIRDIDVFLSAQVPISPGAHLKLTELKITDIGKLKVHFHGLGPLDWVVESLGGFIGNLIRNWLSKVLQGPLKNIIQQMLDNLPIP